MAEPTATLKSSASYRVVIPYEANVGDDDGCVASTEDALDSGSYLVFRALADGMVEVETARGDAFFLAANNTLWVAANKVGGFKALTVAPRLAVDNGFMPEFISLAGEIAACWSLRGSAESELETPQKADVHRFFAAVKKLFPAEFAGE